MKKELLIIIPVYNEEKSIAGVLKDLREANVYAFADVLLMDDASKDDSVKMIKNEDCILIQNSTHKGYGATIQSGYRYGVEHEYSYIIQMDGDGQHDVENIPKIFKELKSKGINHRYPDIVIGSRYMEGSSYFRTGNLKMFAITLFRSIIFSLTGQRVLDPTSGLQGLSRPAFSYYAADGHFDPKYPDANMVLQMLLLKFDIREVPAKMHNRQYGKGMYSGLKPMFYMCYMGLSLCSIIIKYKWRKTDEGIGEKDVIWETQGKSHPTEI